MFDCQDLGFSAELSQQRIDRALRVFELDVLRRLICFALYLLGVDRTALSEVTQMPPGSVRSVLRVLLRDGVSALEDRRQRGFSPPRPPKPGPAPARVKLREDDQLLMIDLGIPAGTLNIPTRNRLQIRAVLLSMVNSGLLSRKEVAARLDLTAVHTGNLARQLDQDDIPSLIDKRQGQKQDYRVTADVKAELIQQFVVDVVSEGRTSGRLLSEHLRQRCELVIPDRTVRHHVAQLGLPRIRLSLPQLLRELKKNSVS